MSTLSIVFVILSIVFLFADQINFEIKNIIVCFGFVILAYLDRIFLVIRQQQNDLAALWQVLIDSVEENDKEEE